MKPHYRLLRDAILIVLGCFLMALAVDVFLDPNDVVPGGFTAIAIFANRLRGWPTGLTLLALNVPFFALGVWLLGAELGPKTFAAVGLVSLALGGGFGWSHRMHMSAARWQLSPLSQCTSSMQRG